MTLAYVVFDRGKPLCIYRQKEQAEWMQYLLGPNSTIKRFTSKTLLQLMQRRAS